MNILIHNVTIFTNDDEENILENQSVAISGHLISEIGEEEKLETKYSNYYQIDGGGALLMPGLINAHTHLYTLPAQNISHNQKTDSFNDFLSKYYWQIDSAMDEETVYYTALISAIKAIKNGVTTLIDHHASPNCIPGILDRIEEALKMVGMKAVLSYDVSDRDGIDVSKAGLRENERYIKKCNSLNRNNSEPEFHGILGLHSSFILENETLEEASDLLKRLNCGAHFHLSEDSLDGTLTYQKFKKGIVKRLYQFNVLGKKSIAVHCIFLTEAEKDLLAQTGTMVVHCPSSNMRSIVGRTKIFDHISRNQIVGIGTDGLLSDIRSEARNSLWLQNHTFNDNSAGWEALKQITLNNNPQIIKNITGIKTGKVKTGYVADLVLVNYFSPTPITSDNFWQHFIYGIADSQITSSIINGKLVMHKNEIIGIDEQRLTKVCQEATKKILAKISNKN